jgi:hypothetical protein
MISGLLGWPHQSRAVSALLRWVDNSPSSAVAVLALALVVPSVNTVTYDGLPISSPWEVGAFAALMPFVFSATLRAAFAELIRERIPWGSRGLVLGALAVMLIKLLLLGLGSDQGFVACYQAIIHPPSTPCEQSYANWLDRHNGATRVDEGINFGPSEAQASNLDPAFPSLAYRKGIATTNWNLSFANDLRFNEATKRTSATAAISWHEIMPFTATWMGTASIPSDGLIKVEYVGHGTLRIGGTEVQLPATVRPRLIETHVPGGDQPLQAQFGYAEGASFSALRVLDHANAPIGAAAPGIPEEILAAIIFIGLTVAYLGLAIVALAALGRDLWLLGTVVVGAIAIALLASPGQHEGFTYLAAALAFIFIYRMPRRPMLWAYGALLAIETVGVLSATPDIHAVLYRSSGGDFLTYASFARGIVLSPSLKGGEAVFFYQPGWRYLLGLLHLLFGDGDALVTLWSMIGVSLPFIALIVWHRRRIGSRFAVAALAVTGFLLLAVLNSPTVLSFVALGASEVPSWPLLALAVAAPQLRPDRDLAWIGSAAAAALIWVMRNNHALAAAAILMAIALTIRRRRRLLVIALGVALAIALLPAVHNLAYGGRFVASTTSMAHDQKISLGDLDQVFSNTHVGALIRGHIDAILYSPPKQRLTTASFGWLLWTLLGLWIAALVATIGMQRRRRFSVSHWLILLLPIAYLAPHIVYQVEIYFPRHIIAGYLAMGVSTMAVIASFAARRQQAYEKVAAAQEMRNPHTCGTEAPA